MVSTVYGLFTLYFLVLAASLLFAPNPLKLYLSCGLEAFTGLAFVIYGGVIGGSLYETNRRMNEGIMRKIMRLEESEIKSRLLKIDTTVPDNYKFTVWIVRILGIGLIATSAFSFVVFGFK